LDWCDNAQLVTNNWRAVAGDEKEQPMCQRDGARKALTFAVSHFNSAQYSPIRGGELRKYTRQ
jgi:hypothetical protein